MDSDAKNKKLPLDLERDECVVKLDEGKQGDTSKIVLPSKDLDDLCLDFESFGKKKKKKKRPINWDEIDANIPCTSRQALQLDSTNEEFGDENEMTTPTPTPTPNESPNMTPTVRSPRINLNIEDTEEFDFSLATKKKKCNKKELSDLGVGIANEEEMQYVYNDDSFSLDFENFGKKKKKKKKSINLDELDDVEGLCTSTHSLVLISKSKEQIDNHSDMDEIKSKETSIMTSSTLNLIPMEAPMTVTPMTHTPSTTVEDEIELDIDFSLGKKKKKSKKKELNDLGVGDKNEEEDKLNQMTEDNDPNAPSWAGSSRDYTYDELLKRIFDIMLEKNPELATGRKPKFIMRPPQVLRVGSKKTSFANFMDIAKTLHRLPKHLLDFLLAELGTSGSMDGNQQLIIKGRFQAKQIENVLRRYIKEYVTCHTCRSPETILQKNTRLFFLQCESCGSRCSVASIKSGFQAVTSKRAAIRAKYT